MPIQCNPDSPNGAWFEELCALGAIGELTSSEFEELQHHLVDCDTCRALYADFCRISCADLGFAAIQRAAEGSQDAAAIALDEKELLSRLLGRAQEARRAGAVRKNYYPTATLRRRWGFALSHLRTWMISPVLARGVAVLGIAAMVGLGAYWVRGRQLSTSLSQLRVQADRWEREAEGTKAQQRSMTQLVQQNQSEEEMLRTALAAAQTNAAQLQSRLGDVQSALRGSEKRAEQLDQEKQSARNSAAEKDKLVQQLEVQLNDLAGQKDKLIQQLQAQLVSVSLLSEERERLVAGLREKLRRAERDANANPPIQESETRELLGARDLHIVDVYDVESSGKMRRTYGRVFYIEKKLLVFYAFDLEGKKWNRAVGGFQAWGYRQPNATKPENLGLFTIEDAKLNRWVLTVNDSRILARIDAVFVTAEPAGGSPFPRGRKVLYASLAGPPNHP